MGKTNFAITHPVLLPSALEYLDADDRIERLVVTNSIPIPVEKLHPKLEIISIAGLLAETIRRIHCGESISPLLIKT